MIFRLLNDQVGAFARGQNVFAEVDGINGFPNLNCGGDGFIDGESGVAVKVRGWILEYCVSQCQEAIDVPLTDVIFLRIDVNGKIEEIRDECARWAAVSTITGLQDV